MGSRGAGKSTVAEWYHHQHDFVYINFADKLKDILAVVFNWDRRLLEGDTKKSRLFRETVDPYWSAKLGIPDLTPRWAMKNVSDALKSVLGTDYFVHVLENEINSINGNVVVGDVRFLVEIALLERLNADFYWVIGRDEETTVRDHASDLEWREKAQHPTTRRVLNTGTIAELYSQLETNYAHSRYALYG